MNCVFSLRTLRSTYIEELFGDVVCADAILEAQVELIFAGQEFPTLIQILIRTVQLAAAAVNVNLRVNSVLKKKKEMVVTTTRTSKCRWRPLTKASLWLIDLQLETNQAARSCLRPTNASDRSFPKDSIKSLNCGDPSGG
jgi:hypothetical protein